MSLLTRAALLYHTDPMGLIEKVHHDNHSRSPDLPAKAGFFDKGYSRNVDLKG